MHGRPPHPKIKELRLLKGGWTSGGHNFDDRMRCSRCGRSWERHQKAPSYCRPAAEALRKGQASQVA